MFEISYSAGNIVLYGEEEGVQEIIGDLSMLASQLGSISFLKKKKNAMPSCHGWQEINGCISMLAVY